MAEPSVELTVERLSKLGEGVAHWDGRAVFIQGGLPGDVLQVRVTPDGKVLRGALERVLTPAPQRRAPSCALFERCGGCDWLALTEAGQREAHQEIVLSALERTAGVARSDLNLLPTRIFPKTLGYRRRAVLHWGPEGLGYFGRRSHRHLAVESCPILSEPLGVLPGKLSPLLAVISRETAAVHLLSEGAQVAVALELKGPVRPKHREAADRVIRAGLAVGVVLTPKEGSAELLGRPVLKGFAPLRPDVPLYFRPDAFSQAHEQGASGLAEAALGLLKVQKDEDVLELYSGNGFFSAALASQGKSVVAVEGASVSCGLAQRSAAEGKLGNLRIIQGDVGKVCEGLVREGRRFEVMLADPPRTGAPGIAEWAAGLRVKRVLFVACEVEGLVAGARELVARGFKPSQLQLLEMFPQTRHIEVLLTFFHTAEAR